METVEYLCRNTERYVLYAGVVTTMGHTYTAGSLCYRYWE